MRTILMVGLGGFVGAVARHFMGAWVQQRLGMPFPYGTFFVNAMGCLFFGALMACAETRVGLSPDTRLLVGVGLLGSFTTFSTFGVETMYLARAGEMRMAFLNVTANLAVGLAFVWAGRSAIRAMFA